MGLLPYCCHLPEVLVPEGVANRPHWVYRVHSNERSLLDGPKNGWKHNRKDLICCNIRCLYMRSGVAPSRTDIPNIKPRVLQEE